MDSELAEESASVFISLRTSSTSLVSRGNASYFAVSSTDADRAFLSPHYSFLHNCHSLAVITHCHSLARLQSPSSSTPSSTPPPRPSTPAGTPTSSEEPWLLPSPLDARLSPEPLPSLRPLRTSTRTSRASWPSSIQRLRPTRGDDADLLLGITHECSWKLQFLMMSRKNVVMDRPLLRLLLSQYLSCDFLDITQ